MTTPLLCFVIMPFKPELGPVHEMICAAVRHTTGTEPIRADDISQPGTIIEQVKRHIEDADFCIGDLSGNNPNVMWELGYAHALGKPVIVLRQGTSDLPFDVRADRLFTYELNALDSARSSLQEAISAVLAGLRGRPRLRGARHDELSILADELNHCFPVRNSARRLLDMVIEAQNFAKKNQLRLTNAREFMQILSEICETQSMRQNSFWWLIVHGVLIYNQIGVFQYDGSNGVETNLELVELSPRGRALLERLAGRHEK
jgi:hypothetical protein